MLLSYRLMSLPFPIPSILHLIQSLQQPLCLYKIELDWIELDRIGLDWVLSSDVPLWDNLSAPASIAGIARFSLSCPARKPISKDTFSSFLQTSQSPNCHYDSEPLNLSLSRNTYHNGQYFRLWDPWYVQVCPKVVRLTYMNMTLTTICFRREIPNFFDRGWDRCDVCKSNFSKSTAHNFACSLY
jgi:hypothetical protein